MSVALRRGAATAASLAALAIAASVVDAQVASDSAQMPPLPWMHWNDGAADCTSSAQPPLEVHAYDASTFILRESLCATAEGPFLYLLVGLDRALLIDTGDITDAREMPLARTVMALLPVRGGARIPLIVVHTHRHLDHRAGDAQFAGLPGVQVVGYDISSVRAFYRFSAWPNRAAPLDLGGRVIDVLPTPGHNETDLVFYDRATTLLFSGDFLLPGRLLVDDADAYRASARRLAAFVHDRPVRYVLGGHVERNAAGDVYAWGTHSHPDERGLAMNRSDVMALPAFADRFNGFYSESDGVEMLNDVRVLTAVCVVGLALVGAFVAAVVAVIRRRRRARTR
ncbi:MAG: MBL fold metallo-hydrolase [bacterium]